MNVWGHYSFHVRGPRLDFEDISQALNLQPTKIVPMPRVYSEDLGQLIPGHQVPSGVLPAGMRLTEGWLYSRSYDKTVIDVSTVFVALLTDLRPRAQAIRGLRGRSDVTDVYVLASFQSDYAQMRFELPREIIQGLHELGTQLGIGIVSDGDPPDGAQALDSVTGADGVLSWDLTGSFILGVRGYDVNWGGMLDWDGITALVGLSPTQTLKCGEDSYGHVRPNGWFHERPFALRAINGEWDTDRMVDVLMGLLRDLGPRVSSIRALNRRPDVTSFTIECHLRSAAREIHFDLPLAAIERLDALDVGLTFEVLSGGLEWNEDNGDTTE